MVVIVQGLIAERGWGCKTVLGFEIGYWGEGCPHLVKEEEEVFDLDFEVFVVLNVLDDVLACRTTR